MDYFYKLDRINEEIEMINEHVVYLVNSMNDIIALNKNYSKASEAMADAQFESLNPLATECTIREEIHQLERKKVELIMERDRIIKRIIYFAKFRVHEVLDIMDKFQSYHKVERVGVRSFIVSQDFNLLKSGCGSIINEEDLKRMLDEYKYGDKVQRSAYFMPMYVKTPNGLEENKHIFTAAAGLEVNDMEGVQVYKETINSVVLNREVVNLLPHDVLAFMDYVITLRLENPAVTIDEAWKQYKLGNTKVLTFSQDDPALEDIYGEAAYVYPYDIFEFMDYMNALRSKDPKITRKEAWRKYKEENKEVPMQKLLYK